MIPEILPLFGSALKSECMHAETHNCTGLHDAGAFSPGTVYVSINPCVMAGMCVSTPHHGGAM